MGGLAKSRVLLSVCMVALVYTINGCGTDNPVEIDTPKESPPSHQFFTAGTQYRLDIRGVREDLPPVDIGLVFTWVQQNASPSASVQRADTTLFIGMQSGIEVGRGVVAHFQFNGGICPPATGRGSGSEGWIDLHVSDAGFNVRPVPHLNPDRVEGLAAEFESIGSIDRSCDGLIFQTNPRPLNRHYTVTIMN